MIGRMDWMQRRMNENNVIWEDRYVQRQERNRINNHKSGFLLLTGLSASGKSTIAHNVERELFSRGVQVYVLDGDNIRHGLNGNLSFSREDRKENLRRVAEVAKLFADAGMLVLGAFIFPFREDREYIRERFRDDNFAEIYIKCPLGECEKRDPKGQYKRARAGIIRNYTGISSPYEEPDSPDLIVDSGRLSVPDSAGMILDFLNNRELLHPPH